MENDRSERTRSGDFMLAEYQAMTSSFWESEQIGERRVTFFVTLTAAVIGGSAFLERGIPRQGESVNPIIYFGLFGILVFGLATLARIIRRNLESHMYLRLARRVRRYFADKDPEIIPYLPFEAFDDEPQRRSEWKHILSWRTGGLLETVSLLNAVVSAMIVALVLLHYSATRVLSFAAAAAAAPTVWFLEFWYAKSAYERGKPNPDEIRFPRPSK